MYLMDTNIVSELMRPVPNATVLRWFGSIAQFTQPLALSVVTVDEIVFGLARKPRKAGSAFFDEFVASSRVLEVTETVARRGGEMRGLLATRGQVRSQPDMLIAATAQVHALTLVTRNVSDFDGCGIAVLNPFDA